MVSQGDKRTVPLSPNQKEEGVLPETSKVSYLFVVITGIFISCLLISNMIAGKLITIGGIVLPGAVVLFPLAYIVGDVLTEVYGFARARLVIWIGFLCNLLMVLAFYLVLVLPAPEFFADGEAYALVLGMAPRVVLASLAAYWVGEFINAIIMSRLKILTRGRFLWVRTIGSSLVGQGLDTIIFITIVFWGTVGNNTLIQMIIYQYLFKITYEILATPVTYAVTGWLKAREGMDIYDEGIRYNPFQLFKSR